MCICLGVMVEHALSIVFSHIFVLTLELSVKWDKGGWEKTWARLSFGSRRKDSWVWGQSWVGVNEPSLEDHAPCAWRWHHPLGRVDVTFLLFKVERRVYDLGCKFFIEKSLKCLHFPDRLTFTPKIHIEDTLRLTLLCYVCGIYSILHFSS